MNGMEIEQLDENKGEHQPCIWMSRLFEAALLLALYLLDVCLFDLFWIF